MEEIINNKIKKKYYLLFMKKIQNHLIIKKTLQAKIVKYQIKKAMESLLINVIIKMQNRVLNEKLKVFLVKKFLYKVIQQYIEHYKELASSRLSLSEIKLKQSIIIDNNKKQFELLKLKNNFYSFLSSLEASMNNKKVGLIKNSFLYNQKKNHIKYFFYQCKKLSFISNKKKDCYKLFFSQINLILIDKTKRNVALQNYNFFVLSLNFAYFRKKAKTCKDRKTKKELIRNNVCKIFIDRCKLKKDNNRKFELLNKKFKENENIIKIHKNEIKNFMILFAKKCENIKKNKITLKRKIFNILKKNVEISKDLKHYLSELNEIE